VLIKQILSLGSLPSSGPETHDQLDQADVIAVIRSVKSKAKKQRFVNYYERDKNLRAAAVEHHGVTCKVCDFNFEETYGEHGKDYIEVHHLRPVSALGKQTKVDP
jgi:predicted HNH restriction endonuclease